MNFTSNISGSRTTNTADPKQVSRSAARDADLRKRLLQKQLQVAKQQEQQKPQEAPVVPQPTSSRQWTPAEIQKKKRQFQKLKFFLYQLDAELEKTLARKIYLLGAVTS
ncbi:hypothetical protein G6F56_012028 [Rhizopus delemar]|nr:hypothetical protein G6F56_012028 [Rhizopus delemar]